MSSGHGLRTWCAFEFQLVTVTNLFHALYFSSTLNGKQYFYDVSCLIIRINSGSNAYRRIQGWGSHRSLQHPPATTHFGRYEKLRLGDLSWRTFFVLSPTRTNYVQISYQILPADSQVQARKKHSFTDQPRRTTGTTAMSSFRVLQPAQRTVAHWRPQRPSLWP